MRERLTNGGHVNSQKKSSECFAPAAPSTFCAPLSIPVAATPAVRMTLVHLGTSVISRGIQQVGQCKPARPSVVFSQLGVGRSQLARRLSSPSLECISECAHLMKTEQPRNLGYMHLAVVEVTNR